MDIYEKIDSVKLEMKNEMSQIHQALNMLMDNHLPKSTSEIDNKDSKITDIVSGSAGMVGQGVNAGFKKVKKFSRLSRLRCGS